MAGPSFCRERATADPESTTVRALAVDGAGTLFVDTGLSEESTVGRIEPGGRTQLFKTGVKGGQDPFSSLPKAPGISSSGRLAPDGAGGVYIAAGTRVLRLDPAGGVALAAGNPAIAPESVRGPAGPEEGSAIGFSFQAIRSIASDNRGNLYVADEAGPGSAAFQIRFVNLGPGEITFYSGTPQAVTVSPGKVGTIVGATGGAGDSEDARTARLSGIPPALAVEWPKLYFSMYQPESGNPMAGRDSSPGGKGAQATSLVKMVNLGERPLSAHGTTVAPGKMTTVAGSGPAGFAGDGGGALQARLSYVPGMTVKENDDLLLADELNHRIRRIDAGGRITTFAGRGAVGKRGGAVNANNIPAAEARLNRPYDVKAGPDGRVYISDRLNRQVRVVDTEGVIRAMPGSGLGLGWRCQPVNSASRGARQKQSSARPASLAVDSLGGAYFSLRELPGLKQIRQAGLIEAIPGSAAANSLIAARPAGGLYLLERSAARLRFYNNTAKRISVNGKSVNPRSWRTVLDGRSQRAQATSASFESVLSQATSVAAVGESVYVASGSVLIETDAAGRNRSKLTEGEACCQAIKSLSGDGQSKLLISETRSPGVWLMNVGHRPITAYGEAVKPGESTLVAGKPQCAGGLGPSEECFGFGGDGGPARQAQLRLIAGTALDRRGNLYLSDLQAHTVRRVDRAGIITTVAGTGQGGFNGDGQPAGFTLLDSPADVAVDRCGNLLINDQGNRRIRRLNVSPAAECAPAPG